MNKTALGLAKPRRQKSSLDRVKVPSAGESFVMTIVIRSKMVYNDGYNPEHPVWKESDNDPPKERPVASTGQQ